jgi:hypothetical protein
MLHDLGNRNATMDLRRADAPRGRKCEDCPAWVSTEGKRGGKRRCPACADIRRMKQQSELRRKRYYAKKAAQNAK